jgi:glutaredoxin-related protein
MGRYCCGAMGDTNNNALGTDDTCLCIEVDFSSYNVLADEDLREGVKQYSYVLL